MVLAGYIYPFHPQPPIVLPFAMSQKVTSMVVIKHRICSSLMILLPFQACAVACATTVVRLTKPQLHAQALAKLAKTSPAVKTSVLGNCIPLLVCTIEHLLCRYILCSLPEFFAGYKDFKIHLSWTCWDSQSSIFLSSILAVPQICHTHSVTSVA